MTIPTLDGTNALIRHKLTAVILATGGADMVRAVYAAGKPAYGVGPGNVPAIIERTAHVDKAVADVVDGKTFDAGVLCSAENSVICDVPIERGVRDAFRCERAHFCSAEEKMALECLMIPPTGKGINPDVVGKQPQEIARRAGFAIAPDAKLLIVELGKVGRDDPLSREKLAPVLGFFVENGWERCCERAIQLLNYGGRGRSLGIHSRDRHVIERFSKEKPAFRIVVNSNVAIGAVGYTTAFAPALTLGPGSWGSSITSDNVAPLHLINIKRLGEEIRPYVDPLHGATTSARPPAGSEPRLTRPRPANAPRIDVRIGVSNRHVHVSAAHLQALFGGAPLTMARQLTQPGQFAAAETVSIHGPKGRIDKARIGGPVRGETQVEIAAADAAFLGVDPPVVRAERSMHPSAVSRWLVPPVEWSCTVVSSLPLGICMSPPPMLGAGDCATAIGSMFAVAWGHELPPCAMCSFVPATDTSPNSTSTLTRPELSPCAATMPRPSSRGVATGRRGGRSSPSGMWCGSPAPAAACQPRRFSRPAPATAPCR